MEKTQQWDVIIIGAGPSGSSAALKLAQGGKRVLVLDKVPFPRIKPCGGGLTPKTLKRLPFSVESVIEHRCHGMEITNRYTQGRRLTHPSPICAMVQRPAFDALLLHHATAAGAVFQVHPGLKTVTQTGQGVTLTFESGEPLTSSFLIAADGAKSTVRRLLHPQPVVYQTFAMEGETPRPNGFDHLVFDFFVVPWGYGWVFPKGNHLNVGIGTFKRHVKLSRAELLAYAERKLGITSLSNIVGHPLGLGPFNGRRAIGRVLFVGDAAGSVEPLAGEGLHNAITSGQIAAQTLLHHTCPAAVRMGYMLRSWPLRVDLAFTQCFAFIFYRFPNFGYRIFQRPNVFYHLVNGLAQGRMFTPTVLITLAKGLRRRHAPANASHPT